MTPPPDIRIRHADNLRHAIKCSQMSFATRNRALRALDRYEATAGPAGDGPEPLVFDRLIEIAETCSAAGTSASRLPSAPWAIAAIERMLQTNPDL